MKYLIIAILFALTVIGCNKAGTTTNYINGTEQSLPPELKGLKVYRVSLGNGDGIYVGVLNSQVIATETNGKYETNTIMVDVSKDKIVYETDSLILLKK